ncbi:MAG: hypothetical protein K2Y39_19670 [Candidatus Obscuribacterales bacterium]|nr:hypothetical protein [Candidatus Obscuribacterales bacterium]
MRQTRQNLCHKIANESLFVGFAVSLLTIVATAAYSLVWPTILVLFTVRAACDFSQCSVNLTERCDESHESGKTRILQPLKV